MRQTSEEKNGGFEETAQQHFEAGGEDSKSMEYGRGSVRNNEKTIDARARTKREYGCERRALTDLLMTFGMNKGLLEECEILRKLLWQ